MMTEMNPEVFREYDVRGIVDKDLTPDFVYLLGRAIGTYAFRQGARKMTLGRDCRLSSETYQEAVGRGIMTAGIDTIDIGLCATPMLYFSIRHLQADGGVMVTGSHNPPDFNGFKICIGPDTIYGEEIQQLRIEIDAVKRTKQVDEITKDGKEGIGIIPFQVVKRVQSQSLGPADRAPITQGTGSLRRTIFPVRGST